MPVINVIPSSNKNNLRIIIPLLKPWPYLANAIKISNCKLNTFALVDPAPYNLLLLGSNGCNTIKAVKRGDIRLIDITNTQINYWQEVNPSF